MRYVCEINNRLSLTLRNRHVRQQSLVVVVVVRRRLLGGDNDADELCGGGTEPSASCGCGESMYPCERWERHEIGDRCEDEEATGNQDGRRISPCVSPQRKGPAAGRRMGRKKMQMGQAEASQWMGSSALARGPWSQDRRHGERREKKEWECYSGLGSRPRAAENRRHGATRRRATDEAAYPPGGGRSQYGQGWRLLLRKPVITSKLIRIAAASLGLVESWSRGRSALAVTLYPSKPLNPALDGLSAVLVMTFGAWIPTFSHHHAAGLRDSFEQGPPPEHDPETLDL